MSFEPCASCRRHVASSDATCPFCGHRTSVVPRPAPSYLGRAARAAVFAGMTACGGSQGAKSPPPPPPVEYPFVLPPAPEEGKASLSGVVRQDGRRMSGMSVTLTNTEDKTTQTVYTNSKGEFQFLNLAPGSYSVMPSPGYENPRPQDGPVLQMDVPVDLAPNANERRDLSVVAPMPYVPDTGPCCKPYGAPPARRRIV